jgi:hypothetical protein
MDDLSKLNGRPLGLALALALLFVAALLWALPGATAAPY